MGFSLLQTPFLQLPLPHPAPHPVPAFLQLDTHLEKDDLTALSRLDALCVTLDCDSNSSLLLPHAGTKLVLLDHCVPSTQGRAWHTYFYEPWLDCLSQGTMQGWC